MSRLERNRRLLRDAVAEYPYEPFFTLRLAEDSLELLEDEVLPVPGHPKSTNSSRKPGTSSAACPNARRAS